MTVLFNRGAGSQGVREKEQARREYGKRSKQGWYDVQIMREVFRICVKMNSIREVSRLPSAIMRKTLMHRDATGLQAVNTVAVCCSERDAAGKGKVSLSIRMAA